LEISPGPGPPADEFFGIANGLKPDRFGWLTPVKVNATEPVGA
jgi:branched-chain amino acid aminotransferase